MKKVNEKINVLISPTSECNMNCIYCYNKPNKNIYKMSIKTLQKVYTVISRDYEYVDIIWHGGEPMLMGVDFYKNALMLQREYTKTKFCNKMQSNLSLLTESMANLIKENKVSIGSSFDGIHNEMTRGNSELILKNRELLLQKGISCGFIFVVSSINLNNLIENYIFFKTREINFTMNLYIPTKEKNNNLLEIEPNLAILRLRELYDYWLHDIDCNIHVNYFERILDFIFCGKKRVCTYTSCLGKWIGIRGNGEIFPCNRWFPQKYSFGNVYQYEHILEAFDSEGFSTLLNEAIVRREKCKDCEVNFLCNGGCNQLAYSEGGISNINRKSCFILRGIFQHILNSIKEFKYHPYLHLEYNPYFLKYYMLGLKRQLKLAI